jgi:HSP20 family protein
MIPRTSAGLSFDPTLTMDAFVRQDELHMVFDLPGVSRDNVQLSYAQGNTIKVSAERNATPDPTDRVLISERAFGRLERSLRLPLEFDATKATAEMRDGILTLVIPRSQSPESNKIDIK